MSEQIARRAQYSSMVLKVDLDEEGPRYGLISDLMQVGQQVGTRGVCSDRYQTCQPETNGQEKIEVEILLT